MQTSYGCIFFKKTSVAAINITLGVPGRRADKLLVHVLPEPNKQREAKLSTFELN